MNVYLRKLIQLKVLLICGVSMMSCTSQPKNLPDQQTTLEAMRRANQYFMDKWPDTGKTIINNKERPSNIWTRAVYYEGLMALNRIDPQDIYIDYAVSWGEFHRWSFRDGVTTRNADNLCAAQTYIDLYELDPQQERIFNTLTSIDSMMATDQINDWDWIDAIQMAMPVFSKLGRVYEDTSYWERMYDMYAYTRNVEGEHGLFNPEDGLWWRDADFDPPYQEPNGEDCYWSRGNGWVVAALVRVLQDIPAEESHRKEYEQDLKQMLAALKKVQRPDGFWNVSLHDPEHFGGKEASGTSLFVYGMAWSIRTGLIDSATYYPVVTKAWNALLSESLQPSGFLGYVQCTGKEPADGQPVTVDKIPDFEDYGLGCFLLAGSEVYLLSGKNNKNE